MGLQYLSDEKGKIMAVQIPIKEWEQLKRHHPDIDTIDTIDNKSPALTNEINNSDFEIGFWHPFGRHGNKSKEDIIKWKTEQIEKNGWTLWSFRFRHSLKPWFEEIEKIKPKKVFVFCSDGNGKDPGSENNGNGDMDEFTHKIYRPINELYYKDIPSDIEVTLPSKNKNERGSAFIVEKINSPVDYDNIRLEWLKDGIWQTRLLPTRPEYLIKKSDKTQPIERKIKAILELKHPYLAEIKKR